MILVGIGDHHPSMCPTVNKQTLDLIHQRVPQLEAIGNELKVKLVGGYSLSPNHRLVFILDAPDYDSARHFLYRSGLTSWNDIVLSPAIPIDVAVKEAEDIQAGRI